MCNSVQKSTRPLLPGYFPKDWNYTIESYREIQKFNYLQVTKTNSVVAHARPKFIWTQWGRLLLQRSLYTLDGSRSPGVGAGGPGEEGVKLLLRRYTSLE